jgi:predicted nucleic acid-binding protein
LAGEQGQTFIYIPSIVLAELYFLNVKYNQPLLFAQEYERLTGSGQFRFVEFCAADVLRFDALTTIPEMHDRMIAAVAHALQLPLLTRDGEIVTSGIIQTIW